MLLHVLCSSAVGIAGSNVKFLAARPYQGREIQRMGFHHFKGSSNGVCVCVNLRAVYAFQNWRFATQHPSIWFHAFSDYSLDCVDLDPSSPIFLLSGTSKVRSADIQMVQIGHPMPSRPETRDSESKLYSHKTGHHKEGIIGYWILLLFMNLAMLYLSVLTACNCAEECCMSSS